MSLPGTARWRSLPSSFLYTPAAGLHRQRQLHLHRQGRSGGQATGTVTVEVERLHTPPIAVPDSAERGRRAVTLDLLANDNDPDGDPCGSPALTLPVEGRITVNPDQTVTYATAAGFSGTDSFTTTVSDGEATDRGRGHGDRDGGGRRPSPTATAIAAAWSSCRSDRRDRPGLRPPGARAGRPAQAGGRRAAR